MSRQRPLRLTSGRQEPSPDVRSALWESLLEECLSPQGVACWEAYKGSRGSTLEAWRSLGVLSQRDLLRDLNRLVLFFEPTASTS